MEPIDKLIIRIGILILGSIFGWTTVQTSKSLDSIAKNTQQITLQAGLISLPSNQKK